MLVQFHGEVGIASWRMVGVAWATGVNIRIM